MKPHKHEKYIKLKADGVLIECCVRNSKYWRVAELRDFDTFDLDFRIAPNQPAKKVKKWRWMYTNKHSTGTEGIYLTPLLTEKEITKWKEDFSSCAVGPRQDWTVCDE